MEAPKSFNIDLRDLSRETWYILPQSGDFLAEVRTNKFGTLTYSRSGGNAEDVTLFDRARKRAISLYASPRRSLSAAQTYNEDNLRTYDVDRLQHRHGRFSRIVSSSRDETHVTLRVQADAAATLTMRLAEPLAVTSVVSTEFGRLLFFRIRNDDSLIINLPVSAQHGAVLTFDIAYSGRIQTQALDRETVALEPQQDDDSEPEPLIQSEPNFLLSSRSAWYPQNVVTDYARARFASPYPKAMRVWRADSSRQATSRCGTPPRRRGRSYVFNANQPVRYFAVVVSRLTRVADSVVDARDRSIPVAATYRLPGRPGAECAATTASRSGSRRIRGRSGVAATLRPWRPTSCGFTER